MEYTAKNEAELTWRSQKEWGAVGNTHRSQVTLDNGDTWKFVVDQPRKGQWTARGWRYEQGAETGDMRFYREDRTLKGAKAQCQAQVNLAAVQTCGECRRIAGHELDCSISQATAREQMRGQKLGLRGLTEAFQAVGPVMASTLKGINEGLWTNVRRPKGCTCPTPTHRMSCGHGAHPKVVS